MGNVDDEPTEQSRAKSARGGQILRLGQKRLLALPSRLLLAPCRAVPLAGRRMETAGKTRQLHRETGRLFSRRARRIRAGALTGPSCFSAIAAKLRVRFTLNGGTLPAWTRRAAGVALVAFGGR